MELSTTQQKKLKILLAVKAKGLPVVLSQLFELGDRLEQEIASVKELIGELNVGSELDDDHLIELIDSRIPEVKDGKDGKNGRDGRDGKDGKDGANGRDGETPDTARIALEASKLAQEQLLPTIPTTEALTTEITKNGEAIRDSLELLQGDDRLDKSAIKGLEEELASIRKSQMTIGSNVANGGASRESFGEIDISDQFDGSNSTFDIPAIYKIITVDLSSTPFALRKGIDYTYDTTSITFTDEINPATSLASGQTCILTVIYA